jgi:hypothetical protein
MVYVVFQVFYDSPMGYVGVFESHEYAEVAIAKLQKGQGLNVELTVEGDYKIFAVRMNSVGL